MYKIYFNNKSKEVFKKEKLNEVKVSSMIQNYLKDEKLTSNQDIICVLELPDKTLSVMGSKTNNKIDIIHATSKAIIA